MKKIISTLSIVLLSVIILVGAPRCNNTIANTDKNQANSEQVQNNSEVQAYYFHLTHRCVTCQAVEKVTGDALKELYGNKIAFQSINIEEDKENPLIEKYKISGQTLLIIKGDKVIDLTNEAFMNARTNPDKLKSLIKSTVDSLI